jgi:hypothetical protein
VVFPSESEEIKRIPICMCGNFPNVWRKDVNVVFLLSKTSFAPFLTFSLVVYYTLSLNAVITGEVADAFMKKYYYTRSQ